MPEFDNTPPEAPNARNLDPDCRDPDLARLTDAMIEGMGAARPGQLAALAGWADRARDNVRRLNRLLDGRDVPTILSPTGELTAVREVMEPDGVLQRVPPSPRTTEVLRGRAILQSDLLNPRLVPLDEGTTTDERHLLATALLDGLGDEATEARLAALIAWAERTLDTEDRLNSIVDGTMVPTGVDATGEPSGLRFSASMLSQLAAARASRVRA